MDCRGQTKILKEAAKCQFQNLKPHSFAMGSPELQSGNAAEALDHRRD
jgi:hypothetical protein